MNSFNNFPVSNQICSIETLSENNFAKWKSDVELALGLPDFDIALTEDKPAALIIESTQAQKDHFHKWEKANKLSMLIIKKSMSGEFQGFSIDIKTAKGLLEAIGNRYKESEKDETGELMDYLTNTKYDGVSGVRAHILKMEDIANRLTKLKVPIAESFLVYQILNSLPQKGWDHLKLPITSKMIPGQSMPLFLCVLELKRKMGRRRGRSCELSN
ncbi:uncharacterized protein LOC141608189 [Silene latifolia]|uniref:uncharacterized protein LOC141608189 n=1 Tax=Silene latifolia TaxID=37657 RepID=UPI003D77686E